MIGWCVERKCFVACLFFESSQHPTWPQVRQRRRCTQVSPMARHSSQPAVFGLSVSDEVKMAAARRHDAAPVRVPRYQAATGQILMDQRDDGRAFPDRAAHALDGTRTDVADGEHARHGRLERGRQAARRADRARLARQHEAMRITRHATAVEPIGLGVGADEQEHVAYRPLLLEAGLAVAPGHCRESLRQVAVELRQLGVRMQLDVRRGVDAVDQVARHAGGEPGPAHQHVDP